MSSGRRNVCFPRARSSKVWGFPRWLYRLRSTRSGESASGDLSAEAEFSSFECVRLRHGFLSTIQIVENELSEEAIANFAFDGQVLLTVRIDEVNVATRFLATDINVLPQLDIPFRPENERAPVAPRAESVGREP